MSRRQYRFNLIVLTGLFIAYVLYEFAKWVATFSILTWLTIGIVVIGGLFLWRHMNQLKVLKEKEQQRLDQRRLGNLNELTRMDPLKFEAYVCGLFVQLGYEAYLTKASGDGGKDILIYKGNSFTIAECKRYVKTKIGRPDIQKFHSAILDCNAEKGYFITTSEFTTTAAAYVSDKPIELINGEKLVSLIEEITSRDTAPIHNLEFYLETR